jgi:ribosome recycling factor
MGRMISKADYLAHFDKVLAHTQQEMAALRTGRANVGMLDEVLVEAYGSKMHLNEIGSISAPDPTLLVISPWDKSLIAAVEKAIQAANLNLNPVVDGEVVKVPVPSLTQERREEMIKILHQKAESGRVMMRSTRADVRRQIEDTKGDAGISEDDIEAGFEELDKVVTDYISKIDELVKHKETELTTI